MKALRIVVVMLAAGALAACIRYPSTDIRTTDERPTIAFTGAPEGAQIFVDDVAMGSASRFDGVTESLLVEPGNHVVEVRLDGRTLLSRRVHLGGRATKTFVVR